MHVFAGNVWLYSMNWVIMMSTLSSPVALEVVWTTFSATSADKVGIMTTLESSHHDTNFVITGGTGGCLHNLQCHQCWQSWHHDNSWDFSGSSYMLRLFSVLCWPAILQPGWQPRQMGPWQLLILHTHQMGLISLEGGSWQRGMGDSWCPGYGYPTPRATGNTDTYPMHQGPDSI